MHIAETLGRLRSVQMMRGIAASLVVLMHSLNIADASFRSKTTVAWRAVGVHVGHAGVDMFFVISGFIMFLIATRDAASVGSRPVGSLRFLVRRAARIYPAYWASLVFFMFLPVQPWRQADYHKLLSDPLAFFLLERPGPLHPVGWTLFYEVCFYIAIGAIMLLGARRLTAAFFWLCFLQTVLVVMAATGLIPKLEVLAPVTLEFAMGIVLGRLFQLGKLAAPVSVSVVGVVWMVAAMALMPPENVDYHVFPRVFAFGLPAAVLLYGLLGLDTIRGFRPHNALVSAGDISYSLYLWHVPVLILVATVMRAAGVVAPASLASTVIFLAISTLITVGISIVSYRFVEEPLMKWSSRITKAPPPPVLQLSDRTAAT